MVSRMKVLWLCNIMLPLVAEHFHMEGSNKEGWLSGLVSVLLERKEENGIELAVAFPVQSDLHRDGAFPWMDKEVFRAKIKGLTAYGFVEDTVHPERYEEALERKMRLITDDFAPDVVHCFGTEYPHTLAMCKAFPRKERLLIGIQGLCEVYANTYFANLPEKTVQAVTFRDFVKGDSIVKQQEKFARRGKMEVEAVQLAGNITGRTAWDKHYANKWNPKAHYYHMNETLRANFYTGIWQEQETIPHSIFLSQGDYPIKGLHYMLLALPAIRRKYPDVKVYVAGNSIVNYTTWKDKLKISAYGRYLRRLICQEQLQNHVVFLGKLNAGEMKDQYLKSSLFVCCSTIENSPNSLGEAMLLGMPCVSANVGGISSIFLSGEDGILYEGYRTPKNSFDNECNHKITEESKLQNNVEALASAVLEMWEDSEQRKKYCKNARNHALKNHDRETNYRRMTEIYAKIIGESER